MHGFNFESFERSGSSRAAFETSRRIAEGIYDGPRPVLLVGPPGSGKTHLLWAIVQRVRAGARPTGLALVMAGEFPDKVRRLAADPKPIQQGKPAILLVDDLQGFADDAPALEAVVRAFLDNGHQVILASAVHPDRVTSLGAAFQSLLRDGRAIELRPRAALEAVPAPPAGLSLTDIWRELSLLRRERDDLERELRAQDDLRRENEELRARLAHSQAEEERLNRAVLAVAPALDADAAWRGRLTRAEAEAEAALADQARVQGLLGAAQRALVEARADAAQLRAQLEAGASNLAAVRSEADQAESLLDEAHGALGRAQIERDTARGRVEALEFELEKARRQLALQAAEMDALRELAADESATARAESALLRQRIEAREEAWRAAQAFAARVDADAARIGDELGQLADAARALTRQAGAAGATEGAPARPAPLPAPEALRQRLLFDADLFESVPDSAPRDRNNAHEGRGI